MKEMEVIVTENKANGYTNPTEHWTFDDENITLFIHDLFCSGGFFMYYIWPVYIYEWMNTRWIERCVLLLNRWESTFLAY